MKREKEREREVFKTDGNLQLPAALNPNLNIEFQILEKQKTRKMKGGTVQINWHGTKPVLTLDFHPVSGLLATGGADFDVKV